MATAASAGGKTRNSHSSSSPRHGKSSSTGSSSAGGRSRQTKPKEQRRTTEAELKTKEAITPEDVLALGRATDSYLCPLGANVYGIRFTKFRVRHIETNTLLFEVGNPDASKDGAQGEDAPSSREVHYILPEEVLRLRQLGALIEFKIGEKAIDNFRMIEVHYFGERRLKIFDFKFGFCIPNSVNSCEHMYDLPDLDDATIDAMVSQPKSTKSDSFYFAEGKLVMHNRCAYTFQRANEETSDEGDLDHSDMADRLRSMD